MVFVVLPHHSYYRYFYPLTTVVMWLGATKNRTFNAEKPPFGAVFLKKGGPSDRIRTCGILLPKQARYQLRYTRIQLLLYRKRKENATEIFGNLSGIAKEAGGWYNGRKNRREDC